MIRAIFWLVLVLNLAVFAYLQWGARLIQDNGALQPPLNPDQIKVLGFSPPAPPSLVLPASVPAPVAVAVPPPPVAALSTASAVAPATPPSAACLEWGEFSGADLARANDRLAGLKLGSMLTQREVEHSIGYWVYIPPPKQRTELDAKIKQLKKLGIKDFFVVQEKGKWHDAISLNIFKTEDMAKKYLDHLKARGVKSAVLGERQTRLKFTVFSLKNPDAATLSKLTEWQKDFSAIEMKSVACN
jgi:hypothetical protein